MFDVIIYVYIGNSESSLGQICGNMFIDVIGNSKEVRASWWMHFINKLKTVNVIGNS